MSRLKRSGLCIAALGLALSSPGCGEDNQKVSQVDGPPAADSLSPEERYKQLSNASTNTAKQGYTGKGNRRTR